MLLTYILTVLGTLVASDPKATPVLESHFRALGGTERLSQVTSIRIRGTARIEDLGGLGGGSVVEPFVTEWRVDGRYRSESGAGASRSVEAYDGEEWWTMRPGLDKPFKRTELPSGLDPRALVLDEIWYAHTRGASVRLLKSGTVARKTGHTLRVGMSDRSCDVFVESATGLRLLRKCGRSGRATSSESFGDFRTIEGLAIPHRIEWRSLVRQLKETRVVSSVEINVEIPDERFQR